MLIGSHFAELGHFLTDTTEPRSEPRSPFVILKVNVTWIQMLKAFNVIPTSNT